MSRLKSKCFVKLKYISRIKSNDKSSYFDIEKRGGKKKPSKDLGQLSLVYIN